MKYLRPKNTFISCYTLKEIDKGNFFFSTFLEFESRWMNCSNLIWAYFHWYRKFIFEQKMNFVLGRKPKNIFCILENSFFC